MFKMPKFISDKNKKVTLASKTFVFALLVSAMMLFVSVPAFAGENHIYDPAGYLSADEEAGLNRIAGDIAEGQNFSLGVVYLNEELDSELWDYCSEYIWETDFAYDTDGNGLLFALDNYSGTYVMYTLGSGTDIFTQSVQDEIFENMYPYYDSGDMYSFAESFLQLSFEEVAAQGSFEGLRRVVDNADLLTDSEEAALETRIADMAKRYLFDIVLVTTYGTDGKDIKTYTEDFFDFNGYGYGENYDGLIFAIDMQAREFWSAGTGIGEDVFNNSVIDDLTDIVTPYLSDGEYYEAMDAYLDEAAFYLEMDLGAQGDYKGSEDYDYSLSFGDYFARSAKNLWLVWIICIVVGIIVANVMRVSLKTVKRQPEASQYLKEGSFDVTNSEDMFITSTISRVKIESNKGGGSGGGSSSGRSHSGGGGGF